MVSLSDLDVHLDSSCESLGSPSRRWPWLQRANGTSFIHPLFVKNRSKLQLDEYQNNISIAIELHPFKPPETQTHKNVILRISKGLIKQYRFSTLAEFCAKPSEFAPARNNNTNNNFIKDIDIEEGGYCSHSYFLEFILIYAVLEAPKNMIVLGDVQ